MPTYAKIRPRRSSSTEWNSINPVLTEGEIGIEIPDEGLGSGIVKIKIGDGSTAWNDLPYGLPLSATSIYGGTVENSFDIYVRTGTTAECFLTKDKRVYKEFNKTVLEKHYDNIIRLSDLEIDSFVFPQTLVFSEAPSHETIQGYLMRYSKGIDIAHVSSLVYMRDFLRALAKLEEDIKLLSKSKMDIYDLKGANVLYTNDNRIDVIDTDFYIYSPSLLEEDLNEINTMELEYLLSTFFI